MTRSQQEFENDPQWQDWQKQLQVDVPPAAEESLREIIRGFEENRGLESNIAEKVETASGNAMGRDAVLSPRWNSSDESLASSSGLLHGWFGKSLGAAGTLALAASLVAIMMLNRPDNSRLAKNLPDLPGGSSTTGAGQSSLAFNTPKMPSTMISLTNPSNTVQLFSQIQNGSFEEAFNRHVRPELQPIPSWFFPAECRKAGYEVKLDATESVSGFQCLKIESPKEGKLHFGNIMQTIDATPYRGLNIQLSATIRMGVSPEQGQGHMWLRVDNEDTTLGFFDNMEDRPIVSNDWQKIVIVGPVSENAQYINVGAFLFGQGTMWVDEFQVEPME